MTYELIYTGMTGTAKDIDLYGGAEAAAELARVTAGRKVLSTGKFNAPGDPNTIVLYAVVEASTLTVPGALQ